MDNASLKSERSLNGSDLPELLRDIHQFFLYRKYSVWWEKSFLRKLVHLDTDLLISIMFGWRCTKFRIIQKAIEDPFKTPLEASFSQLMGNMIVSLFCSFPISMAMKSSLLNDIILNREKVQCTLNGASVGFTFFQEMPAGAIDDALTPLQ